MVIYIDKCLFRLCNEETASDILFKCAALRQRRVAIQGALELALEKDLSNMPLNLE